MNTTTNDSMNTTPNNGRNDDPSADQRNRHSVNQHDDQPPSTRPIPYIYITNGPTLQSIHTKNSIWVPFLGPCGSTGI